MEGRGGKQSFPSLLKILSSACGRRGGKHNPDFIAAGSLGDVFEERLDVVDAGEGLW